MATGKTHPQGKRRPALRGRHLVAGIGIAAVALGWQAGPELLARVQAGTAYGARIACSCRHAGGRDLADCRKDFEPGMELVMLSEDEKAKSVTASVPLIARQTATWHEGYGCLLEPWRD